MIHKSKVLLPFDIYSTAITGHRHIRLSSLLAVHFWKEKSAGILSVFASSFDTVQCHYNVYPGPVIMIGYGAGNICIVFTATSLSTVISCHCVIMLPVTYGRKLYNQMG